jgi:hypothetical protein
VVSNTLLVLRGNGAGDFTVQAPQVVDNLGGAPFATDFNGDSLLDLVFRRGSEVSLFAGDSLGAFSEVKTLPVFGPVALAAGDINGDGLLDVGVASDFDLNSSHLGVLLGVDGGFEVLPLLPASGGNLRGIALADFNNDGALDAVLTDQSNAQVIVFLSEP